MGLGCNFSTTFAGYGRPDNHELKQGEGVIKLKRITTISAVIAILASLGGCATIMEGSDQAINVNTTGCEEQGTVICTLTNKDGASVITVPATVMSEVQRLSYGVM